MADTGSGAMQEDGAIGAAEAPRFRAYVHLARGFEASRCAERFRRGEANDLTPYGFHLAEEMGVSITFATAPDDPAATRRAEWLMRRLGFDFLHAWHNRDAIAASDVVWTMTESEAFAVAALMAARIVAKKPIVGNAVWLFDRWSSMTAFKRRLFRYLGRYLSILTVHSSACLPVAREVLPDVRCQLTYFGINTDTYPVTAPVAPTPAPGGGRPIRVMAAGNDPTRDWPTFIEALADDDSFALSAWTPRLTGEQAARHANLSLPKPATRADIVALYRACDVVVIPMMDNLFSGITVALEAAALGKPIICSATGGVPTYFDEGEATYVSPGDPAALRAAVLRAGTSESLAKAHAAQARFLRCDYTTRAMIGRYVELTLPYLRAGAAPR